MFSKTKNIFFAFRGFGGGRGGGAAVAGCPSPKLWRNLTLTLWQCMAKTVEKWLNKCFAYFRQLSSQKGVKCYTIWIMRPDLESSRHLGYLRPLFVMISTFWFFELHWHFENFDEFHGSMKSVLKWNCWYQTSLNGWNDGNPVGMGGSERKG